MVKRRIKLLEKKNTNEKKPFVRIETQMWNAFFLSRTEWSCRHSDQNRRQVKTKNVNFNLARANQINYTRIWIEVEMSVETPKKKNNQLKRREKMWTKNEHEVDDDKWVQKKKTFSFNFKINLIFNS